MLLFTFLFSLFFSFEPTKTQNKSEESYQIIFVQGTIQIKSSGEVLKRGMQLKPSQQVIFKTKDAKAVVLSTTKGRFVLAPKQAGNSEIAQFVSEVVSPLKTNSKLSTRAGDDGKGIQDFQSHFGKAKNNDSIPSFAMIGDAYSFKVNIARYPISAERYLGINYTKPVKVGRNIKTQGNVATIEKKFHFEDKKVNPDDVDMVKIQFYNVAKKNFEEEVLASFKPIFIDSEELKLTFKDFLDNIDMEESLKTYLKGSKEADSISTLTDLQKKKIVLYYFIQECYGQFDENGNIDVQKLKIDENSLENWLKQNAF